MFTLAIPRPMLCAVARFMANQEIRYYLNGINVTVHANVAYLCATDGSALGLARIARDSCAQMEGQGSVILPREYVEKFKANQNNGLPIVLTAADTEFTLDDCGMRASGKPIEARFPDWDRVIPRKTDGKPAFFNPEYLTRCAKAAKDLGSKAGLFGLAYNGESSAALVSFDCNPDVLAVLMPMRGFDATLPAWVGEEAETLGRETDVNKAWEAALLIEYPTVHEPAAA